MKVNDYRKLQSYVGDPSSIIGFKSYTFNDGLAKGIKAIEINNGRNLNLCVLPGKCLDIPYLKYKGFNIGFLSKTGLVSSTHYQENGTIGFLRQFNGGFLTTCGISYSGQPCEYDENYYGLHGISFSLPAENVHTEVSKNSDDITLSVSGTVHEARVFGENLFLKRTITLETEQDTMYIHDELYNSGFKKAPVMTIYHMNYGFPLLDEGTYVKINSDKVTPNDEISRLGLDSINTIEAPSPDYEQLNYAHTFAADKAKAYSMVYNKKLGIAVVNHFSPKQCPVMNQWKNMLSGDYVLGIEPTLCGTCGLAAAEEAGINNYIEAGETLCFDFKIQFLDNKEEIEKYL